MKHVDNAAHIRAVYTTSAFDGQGCQLLINANRKSASKSSWLYTDSWFLFFKICR